jgi:ELWxxDGT repeat protein
MRRTVSCLSVAALVLASCGGDAAAAGSARSRAGSQIATTPRITVQLVKDINPGPSHAFGGRWRGTSFAANVGGIFFFMGDDGVHGLELWKSDGTDAGTVPLKDINPTGDSLPHELTDVGGTLFFEADDGVHGRELWKSDGTLAGTVLVRDINPGVDNSTPSALIDVGGTALFVAEDGAHGRELWRSDGTESGTVMVKDIWPGPEWSSDGVVDERANVGEILYLQADDGVHGRELWKSDGTMAGTVLVRNINRGNDNSDPHELVDVGGTLFFGVDTGARMELWRSDGTRAGTVHVGSTSFSLCTYCLYELTNVGGTLFFGAYEDVHGYGLWRSDGTMTGTVLVENIAGDTCPNDLTDVAGALFFTCLVGDGELHGELWNSDGTEAGTTRVRRFSTVRSIKDVGGDPIFGASDDVHGSELWTSDGTRVGTVLVEDIRPGASSAAPGLLAVVNGTLFFYANDGIHGRELWALRIA